MLGQASLPDLAPITGLLVLLEICVGTVAVAHLLDLIGRIGRGFVASTVLICAVIMGVVLLLISALGDASVVVGAATPAGASASLMHWSMALLGLLLLDALFCGVGTDIARHAVGLLASVAGVITLAQGAALVSGATGGIGPALLAFLPAALLAGSALAGMLLGHWYLISPDLSFRPLRQAVYTVFAAVGVQALAIAAALLVVEPGGRGSALQGQNAVLFWLLVVGSGVVFTSAVNALTLYFARIRANQPATAMLYVLIITVAMAVVPAHLIFFSSGVPV